MFFSDNKVSFSSFSCFTSSDATSEESRVRKFAPEIRSSPSSSFFPGEGRKERGGEERGGEDVVSKLGRGGVETLSYHGGLSSGRRREREQLQCRGM